MVKLEDRIRAWATVGSILKNLSESEKSEMILSAKAENAWFTEENIEKSIQGVIRYLDEEKLKQWTKDLPEETPSPRKIGVVMAGNIPLVGFHDMLTVLISGHILFAKLSSKDSYLIKHIATILCDIEPRFEENIIFSEQLKNADAMIATGSDNSSRYFEYYFADIPHIIRKNRSSCGILTGEETDEQLKAIGEDIFSYFGLGCRNVSKLYVPEDYYFTKLLDALSPYENVIHHHKYNNNYDYNKSIYLVNQEPHFDTGFLLLRKSDQLVSPISVVYYEQYADEQDLKSKIALEAEKLQCIVSKDGWFTESYPFGEAQSPELWDYADGVDTLAFIRENFS